jgi:hypothetical protein
VPRHGTLDAPPDDADVRDAGDGAASRGGATPHTLVAVTAHDNKSAVARDHPRRLRLATVRARPGLTADPISSPKRVMAAP